MSSNGNNLVTATTDIRLPSDLRYGYWAFIDELKVLEEFYYPSCMDKNLTQSIEKQYSALLKRVKDYANYGKTLSKGEKLDNLGNKDIAILNYVYCAILSRVNQLKSSSSSDLVIDILGFIEIIKSNIKSLSEQQRLEKIDFYKKGYNSQLKKKIDEANSFIEQLHKAIDTYNDEIDDNFTKLIKEVEELKKEAEKNQEELNAKKKELDRQLPFKMLFGSLKVLTSVLAFTGPQAALIGSVINSGSNIAEGFVLNDSKGDKLPLATIPKGAETLISGYKDYSEETKKKREQVARDKIKIIEDILKDKPSEISSKPLEELAIKRGKIEIELNEAISKGDNFDPLDLIKKYDLQKALEKVLSDEKEAVEKKIKSDEKEAIENKNKNDGEKHKKTLEWLDKSQKAVNIASAGVDIYNTYTKHESAIDEIDKVVRENEKTIKKLNEFEDRINSYSQKKITNMEEAITDLENSLKNKSHMALDVSKWEIQAHLKNIKYELDEMTSGFKIHGAFIHIFEKMSDAIATLVDIYDRIENYNEQAQLGDYIANVNAAGVKVDYPEINELKIIILQNTILERYSALISALKQWAFPFAKTLFRDVDFMLDIKSNQDIPTNATNVTKVIELLAEKLKTYNATITKIDTNIVKTSFGLGDSPVVPPFFTWKSDQYADAISTLFKQGSKEYESEEITLISSVQGSSYSAVKFNKIELRIKHTDSTKQQELNSCLNFFNIYLTHSRDSYYKFNNKFYKFGGNIDGNSNDKLQLMYGFEKNKAGSSVTENIAYKKLDKGELMLSPYSVWVLKLALANPSGKNYFTDLEKYSESVYLELVGTGSYIDELPIKDEYKSDLSVDSYYQTYNMIPIIGDLEGYL